MKIRSTTNLHLRFLCNDFTRKFFTTPKTQDAVSEDSFKDIINSTFEKNPIKKEEINPNIKAILKQKLKLKTKDEISQEYQDKLFYLKFQWMRLRKDKIKYKQNYLSRDFNNHQLQEINVVLNIVKHFNDSEYLIYKNHLENISQPFYKKRIVKLKRLPTYDPNYEAYQNILQSLRPFLSSGYFLKGADSDVKSEPVKKEEAKEPEKPKEKAVVNVKLTGFDPAKKIGLIKECRTIFALGLKEAKEMVEKENNVIKANVKREEALELKKKLEEAGGKVELD